MPDNTVMPIVRVAVLAATGGDAAGRLTELALPAGLPLREIIPAVQRTVLPTDDTVDIAPAQLSLAPIGGAPFSLDATLETLNIDDGEQLILCKLPPGPAAPDRRRALSRQAPVPRVVAFWRLHHRPGARLGHQPLLIPVAHSDEGRSLHEPGRGSPAAPRLA